MVQSIPERDWKYMRKIQDDLLNCLCERINQQSMAILKEEGGSEHERFLKHYRHIQDSNRVVGDCFDDWKRSALLLRLAALQYHGLLTQEHIKQLSEETQEKLREFREL